jgi:CheY-like chemotaxis protein
MQPMIDPQRRQASIMAVDDNPENLKLLEDMLRQHDYEVRSFPRGRLALAALDRETPDLVLLDIDMPEMNGYEVCEKLKSNRRHSAIPVIFLSALNAVEDKVHGFRSGAVDYISKPFQFDEVRARVETHIKLRRAQQAEHDLLEKTLGGAVLALWELVQLTSPTLALRSHAVRDIVAWITKQIEIPDAWQCQLAATLCLVGCITLPDDVLERAYYGETLSHEEDQMFRGHPEGAARLLANIPRMEIVSAIIRGQFDPEAASIPEPARKGARLLRLALAFDRKIFQGATTEKAVEVLKATRKFDLEMLDALQSYCPIQPEFQLRRLATHELRVSMVIEKDVCSRDGNLVILKRGTVLTQVWIERLENFARAGRVPESIEVRVPSLGDAPGSGG